MFNMNSKKNILIVFVLLVVLALVGFLVYKNFFTGDGNNLNLNNNAVNGENNTIPLSDSGGIKYEYIGSENSSSNMPNMPAPNLDRKIPDGATDDIRQNIMSISEKLKKDKNSFNLWINLGLYRKSAEDYDGAIEAWKYADTMSGQNPLPLANLGNLYGYYLRDFEKAEDYYLEAVKRSPQSYYLYISMSEFYRDVMKNGEKAISIIEQGIKSNPDNPELKTFLREMES